MQLFDLIRPAEWRLPLVLSVPHAGTWLPADLQAELKPGLLPPDDTDWLVPQLYDFAAEMGIPLLAARPGRWLIDLNRNPDDAPLYHDGRVLTGLCPATTFLGEPLYADQRPRVAPAEVARRRALYFEPYHQALQALLDEARARFGRVLLWDCHSIRRRVPAIHPGPFPDLILGSADGTSAAVGLVGRALSELGGGRYSLSHNSPFKGGYITRHYGRPDLEQHALQLEMSKQVYMNDAEQLYDPARAARLQALLRQTLRALGEALR